MTTKQDQTRARANKAAVTKVCKAIDANQIDQTDLLKVWQRINEALAKGSVGFRWRLVDPALGLDFTEDELTIGDAEVIKARCGATVAECEPLSDATHYGALVYAWLVNHQGRDSVDAATLVQGIPINKAAETIRQEAIAPDPKGL